MKESIDAPKIKYFHWKYEEIENQSDTQKRGTSEIRTITNVFKRESMMTLKNKKGELQECYELLTFLDDFDDSKGRREMTRFRILSMAGTTATF